MKGRSKHIRIAGFLLALILLGMFLYGYGYTDTVKAQFHQQGSSQEANTNTETGSTKPIVFKGELWMRILDLQNHTIKFQRSKMINTPQHSFSVLSGDKYVSGFQFEVVANSVSGGKPPYKYNVEIYLYPTDTLAGVTPLKQVSGTYDPSNFNDRLDVYVYTSVPSWMEAWSTGTHKAEAYAVITLTDSSGESVTYVSQHISITLTVVHYTGEPSATSSWTVTTNTGPTPGPISGPPLPPGKYILPESIVVGVNG